MNVVQTSCTFHCVAFGFLIFRCTRRVKIDGVLRDDSYNQFMEMLGANGWASNDQAFDALCVMAPVLIPLFIVEGLQCWSKDHYFLLQWPFAARAGAYAILLLILILLGVGTGDAFIYFQF